MALSPGITAMAESSEDVVGFEVSATEGKTESKTEENATASLEGSGNATGVDAEAKDKSSATATIEEDVTATATSENQYVEATGVTASSKDESDTTVNIGNDVTAAANSTNGYDYATGITASSNDESTTKVSVGDNVSVNASDSSAGVYATAAGNSKTEVNIGKDLTVSGGTFTDGISATSGAYGDATDSSYVSVTVGGDVTVKGNQGSSDFAKSFGVDATARGSSKTEVAIKGELSASSDGDDVYGSAISVNANDEDSYVGVSVDGDVTSNGLTTVTARGPGDVDITIGGNVINENKSGMALSLTDYYNNDNNTATLTVTVAKDITAIGDAVTITKTSGKSSIDLVVEGTLTGEHAIVLDPVSSSSTGEETQSSTENLSITVWKFETTDSSGSLVSDVKYVSDPTTGDSKKEYTQNEEAEKNINYILKVDPIATSIGGALSFSGTTDIHGFQTAHAGDTVFLELTIPSDYTVDNFYNVDGAANVNVISSGGKYYLEVPRGGGVFVGVNLKRVSSSVSSDSSSSDNDDWTVGQAQKVTTGVFSPTAFTGLTFQAIGADGTPIVLNVLDVLTPLEPVSAFNNFTLARPTYGLNNVLGAAVVDLNDLPATTLGDIVNIPVAANVTAGNNYTVYFSDGTSTTVQCTTDGILTIPFNKNTKGLTYMIYGAQSNPLMGLPSIDAVEPIQQIGIGENAFKSADLNFGFESPTGLKPIGYDTFAGSTELRPQLIGNDGQR